MPRASLHRTWRFNVQFARGSLGHTKAADRRSLDVESARTTVRSICLRRNAVQFHGIIERQIAPHAPASDGETMSARKLMPSAMLSAWYILQILEEAGPAAGRSTSCRATQPISRSHRAIMISLLRAFFTGSNRFVSTEYVGE
jgi:hypothetical protein